MGAESLRGPSPLQSATGIQFNVATVAGHWQLLFDLIDAGIEPGLPHKNRIAQDASAARSSGR